MERVKTIVLSTALACVMALPGLAQDAPKRGGTLTQAVDLEPATLDPIYGNAPGKDRGVYTQMLENLFVQDEAGNFVPQLATSWEIAPDQKSIVFKLREGVVFHDGTPFDAEAVKFNLDRVIDPAQKARARQFVGDMASIEVIDPLTVKVNFSAPSGSVLAGLANEAGMISSPTAVKAKGADYARNPVGTGPFRFVSWKGGDRIAVERFDTYWGKDEKGQQLPYLDAVVTRFIPNTTVKIVELRSGNVQLGDLVQVKDYGQIERDGNTELVPNHVGTAQYMSFNLTKPPFNNPDLRRAVAHGINRNTMERVVSRGEGVIAPTFEPPSSWAFAAALKPHSYDLAQAKEYYKKSGHSGPITLAIIQRDPDTQIAQIIQSQLKDVGITVNIETLERQAWLDKILSYNYDMALQRANTPRVDPDMSFSTYYSRNAGSNYAGIKDEKIFNDVAAARGTTNLEERKKLYSDIQRQLLDEYYQTFFFWRANKDVKRKNIKGVRRELSGNWLVDRAWIAD